MLSKPVFIRITVKETTANPALTTPMDSTERATQIWTNKLIRLKMEKHGQMFFYHPSVAAWLTQLDLIVTT